MPRRFSEEHFYNKRLDAIRESPIGEIGDTPELSEKLLKWSD
jgi:hypothetical protein